jgi:hypothetical protein
LYGKVSFWKGDSVKKIEYEATNKNIIIGGRIESKPLRALLKDSEVLKELTNSVCSFIFEEWNINRVMKRMINTTIKETIINRSAFLFILSIHFTVTWPFLQK